MSKKKNKLLLTAKEVSEYLSISVPMAYKIIRKLNDELEDKGYIVICGKINRQYFESKIYGGLHDEDIPYAGI